jgi:hypothetical protein
MAGKNKVEKGIRVWVDDSGGTRRDLSGDLVPGSLSGPGLSYDAAELTGVSNAVKNFLAGHASTNIACQFHLNDTADTGAYTVITGNQGGTGTITVEFGSAGAAPATNDPDWEGEFVYLGCSVGLNGNVSVINFAAQPTGSTAPAWGLVS